MKLRRRIVGSLFAGLLVITVTGCGGDGGDQDDDTTEASTPAEDTSAPESTSPTEPSSPSPSTTDSGDPVEAMRACLDESEFDYDESGPPRFGATAEIHVNVPIASEGTFAVVGMFAYDTMEAAADAEAGVPLGDTSITEVVGAVILVRTPENEFGKIDPELALIRECADPS